MDANDKYQLYCAEHIQTARDLYHNLKENNLSGMDSPRKVAARIRSCLESVGIGAMAALDETRQLNAEQMSAQLTRVQRDAEKALSTDLMR